MKNSEYQRDVGQAHADKMVLHAELSAEKQNAERQKTMMDEDKNIAIQATQHNVQMAMSAEQVQVRQALDEKDKAIAESHNALRMEKIQADNEIQRMKHELHNAQRQSEAVLSQQDLQTKEQMARMRNECLSEVTMERKTKDEQLVQIRALHDQLRMHQEEKKQPAGSASGAACAAAAGGTECEIPGCSENPAEANCRQCLRTICHKFHYVNFTMLCSECHILADKKEKDDRRKEQDEAMRKMMMHLQESQRDAEKASRQATMEIISVKAKEQQAQNDALNNSIGKLADMMGALAKNLPMMMPSTTTTEPVKITLTPPSGNTGSSASGAAPQENGGSKEEDNKKEKKDKSKKDKNI